MLCLFVLYLFMPMVILHGYCLSLCSWFVALCGHLRLSCVSFCHLFMLILSLCGRFTSRKWGGKIETPQNINQSSTALPLTMTCNFIKSKRYIDMNLLYYYYYLYPLKSEAYTRHKVSTWALLWSLQPEVEFIVPEDLTLRSQGSVRAVCPTPPLQRYLSQCTILREKRGQK